MSSVELIPQIVQGVGYLCHAIDLGHRGAAFERMQRCEHLLRYGQRACLRLFDEGLERQYMGGSFLSEDLDQFGIQLRLRRLFYIDRTCGCFRYGGLLFTHFFEINSC